MAHKEMSAKMDAIAEQARRKIEVDLKRERGES
jgi:hypothetical protein